MKPLHHLETLSDPQIKTDVLSTQKIERICGLLEGILRITNSLNNNNNKSLIQ